MPRALRHPFKPVFSLSDNRPASKKGPSPRLAELGQRCRTDQGLRRPARQHALEPCPLRCGFRPNSDLQGPHPPLRASRKAPARVVGGDGAGANLGFALGEGHWENLAKDLMFQLPKTKRPQLREAGADHPPEWRVIRPHPVSGKLGIQLAVPGVS